jgi:signal transduction histidine kinase
MSKLHQGIVQFTYSAFDAVELFESTVDIARRSIAAQKPITLIFDTNVHQPLCIQSDPVRLNQVLTNLVSNAIKFTDKGSVTVKLWTSDSGAQPLSMMLNFSVEDTGVGIPDKFLEGNLFRTFQQTSEGRSRGGSGLGLAISKQIVAALGGQISCHRCVAFGYA